MTARVTCEKVRARDLRPGDLFSSRGTDYWDNALDKGSCGEMVYVRTNIDADTFNDADELVYWLTVTVEKPNGY